MSQSPLSPSAASQQTVVDTARIMDKAWEEVQKKTFTKWVNTKLQSRGVAIEDPAKDLSDGVNLIHLLEIIGDESLGKYNKQPKLRIQMMENLNTSLNFIKRRGVNLTNIGAEDVVDGNEKLILGMLWTVILRFTIADISEEGLTAKEGLLLWCQRKTSGYAPDVNVRDFTFSWQDGLAFCALIHRHRPDLIPFEQLDKSKKHENMQLAFDVAQKHLGIAKLLDVEDVIDLPKPDERSLMTYVAQYFHAFSNLDKVETSGRRVTKFAQVLQSLQEMRHDYEQRAQQFLSQLTKQQGIWSSTQWDGHYQQAKALSIAFNKYKSTLKRDWFSEKRDLASLLSNIQTKIATYHFAPYVPPETYTLEAMEKAWQSHVSMEDQHKRKINQCIKEQREVLQQQYAQLANPFQATISKLANQLGALTGELEAQLKQVQTWQVECKPMEKTLQELKVLEQACIDANVEDNEFTIYSYQDLDVYFDTLKQGLNQKLAFLENQLVARNMTNVTPAQLEEFESTFRQFDKDHSNTLSALEFKASLAGLGIAYEDEEFDQVFNKASQHQPEVSFEQFVNYVRSVMEDTTSQTQLADSFKALANGKEFITEVDLRNGRLDASTITYLKSVMPEHPSHPGSLDYKAYLNHWFQPSQ